MVAMVLIYLQYFTIGAQYSEEVFKSLFYARITNLSEFEGIYTIKKASLVAPNCIENKKEVTINEKIAIYKDGTILKVYNISKQNDIGTIVLKYESGTYGKLKTSGLSNYMDSDIRKFFWYTEIPIDRRISSLDLSTTLKSAIQIYRNNCPCPEYQSVHCPQLCCGIEITYELEKTFPNANEPPPKGISSGTGVIISPKGFVLTNRHVLEKKEYRWDNNESWVMIENPTKEYFGYKEQVVFDKFYSVNPKLDLYSNLRTNLTTEINGKTYTLRPVIFNSAWEMGYNGPFQQQFFRNEDLIVLYIENYPNDLPYVVFDTLTQVLGNEVYTLGYPLSDILGNQLIYSNGYFSSDQNEFDIYNLGINSGNSGGGIFDKETGNLVGIATAKLNNNALGQNVEGLAFSTRLNDFIRIVKTEGTYRRHMTKDVVHSSTPYWNYRDDGAWSSNTMNILVKDSVFKPIITIEQNKRATIQIKAN